MDADAAPAAAEPAAWSEGVDGTTLAAALRVRVQDDGRQPPTYRFQQRLAFAEALSRRGTLDLAARQFRSTLWAGEHRCLDHVEVAALERVTCDPAAGRVVVEGSGLRLVLSRQGALSVVPVAAAGARAERRTRPDPDG
jgi:hypothetical protein